MLSLPKTKPLTQRPPNPRAIARLNPDGSPQPGQGGNPAPKRLGIWTQKIEGRFRLVTVHQLAMAWWLFNAKHITRRQLRVYFAAHEMAEKRRYTRSEPGQPRRKPLYTLNEVRRLIGGATTATADAALSADIKALGRLGLVKLSAHAIDFAVSVDQITVDDVAGFWAFFDNVPNNRRKVAMPRRTVRALAGGFKPAVMGLMIALMMRSLYWHRPGGKAGEGGYRIDGRTKLSWVAEVFGLGRRSVTDARARLLELGWITEIEAPQWQLNKWGQRYCLNVDAFGPKQAEKGAQASGQIASPTPDNSPQSSSPCLNSKTSSTKKDLKNREPARARSGLGSVGSRKMKRGDAGGPVLTDITTHDLGHTGELLELHKQAIAAGKSTDSEADRLRFIALAERARAHGNNPPKLFAWMLRERRFDFICQTDEDRAAARIRELRNGPRKWGGKRKAPHPQDIELSADDQVVRTCIMAAKTTRMPPHRIARIHKGWTLDQWQAAEEAYQEKERDRWRPAGE